MWNNKRVSERSYSDRLGQRGQTPIVTPISGCPRCQGALFLSRDHYGHYEECLACGYLVDIEVVRGTSYKNPDILSPLEYVLRYEGENENLKDITVGLSIIAKSNRFKGVTPQSLLLKCPHCKLDSSYHHSKSNYMQLVFVCLLKHIVKISPQWYLKLTWS